MSYTPEEIERDKRIIAAASPEPWFVSGVRFRMNGGEWVSVNRYNEPIKQDENIACVGYDKRNGAGQNDAAFIAAARTGWPKALEAIEARDKEIGRLTKPDESWFSGEDVALKHGFTREQYRAAKRIEYRIFGPYEWQNQGDRAASMMVGICDAIREADNRATKAKAERDEAVGLLRQLMKPPILGTTTKGAWSGAPYIRDNDTTRAWIASALSFLAKHKDT